MTELERLALLEQQAEAAYDAMYEAHSPSHAAACYSDAKEALILRDGDRAIDLLNVWRLASRILRRCFARNLRELGSRRNPDHPRAAQCAILRFR